jgi:glycyl-tRNA synthetase
MYIIKKKISGKDYYYLRKSVRKGKKVKSLCIAYLGKNKEEAEKKAKGIEEKAKEEEKINKPKIEQKDMSEKADINNLKKQEFKDEQIKTEQKISNIKEELTIDSLANFCKKKGFVFKSSEIYGGLGGFWDFGPLGVELFNNIKQDWWNYFVKSRKNMVGMEASIISHPKTWEASGHLQNFNDIFVKCKKCNKVGKLDESELGKVKCDCGGEYENHEKFNLMFETKIGTTEPMTAYLRGETAQAMFMDFKLIQQVSRQKLPFGIAQIGRCFRNEISPRDFLFRSREFHIGEFEFFINPEEEKCSLLEKKQLDVKIRLLDAETQKKGKEELRETTIKEMLKEKRLGEWHAYWLAEQVLWFESLGLKEIKIREHTKDELSHYSSATFDIDYEYVFGSKEIAGNANRGQYDLTQHEKFSKEKMEIFDESTGKRVIPKVIEPTFGIERVFLAILTKAYNYDSKRQNIVLKIPAKLAPIKAAVFPIVKQPEYEKIAEEIVNDLKKEFNVVYDEGGSIGRRYARADESGTPMCITIDDLSPKRKDVTIRDRDSTLQIRVKIKELKEVLKRLINNEIEFEKAGKLVDTRVK